MFPIAALGLMVAGLLLFLPDGPKKAAVAPPEGKREPAEKKSPEDVAKVRAENLKKANDARAAKKAEAEKTDAGTK